MSSPFYKLIEEIYSKYDQDTSHDISGLLAAYRGKEKQLIQTLLIKYSANPADLDFFRNYFEINSKEFLSALYSKHNPGKLAEIDNQVIKLQEKKSAFIKQLCVRYNLEPGSLIDFIDLQKFEIKRDNNPKQPERTDKTVYPKKQTTLYNFPKKKKPSYVSRIITVGIIIFVSVVLIVYCSHKRDIMLAKHIEEKRIMDSIRIADSLAMVQAQQQRIADSLAMVQAQQQRIADSISSSQQISRENSGEQILGNKKNADNSRLDTWMVIVGSFKTEEQAGSYQQKVYNDYNLGTEILSTNDYINFAKDLFIVVTKKNVSRTTAEYSLQEIKQLGIDCYIKDSGGKASN